MQLSATRSALLHHRAQIALARQGCELLKDRRDALTQEFMRLGASVLEEMDALEERCAHGRSELEDAVAAEGVESVSSAALAAARQLEVGVVPRTVAGVAIVEVVKPTLQRRATDRGYGVGAASAHVDAVAGAFEAQLDLLLDVVAAELSLRRLAEAIALTTRRVNALEQVIVPRLEAERAYIELVLEERERDERVRLLRARSLQAEAAA